MPDKTHEKQDDHKARSTSSSHTSPLNTGTFCWLPRDLGQRQSEGLPAVWARGRKPAVLPIAQSDQGEDPLKALGATSAVGFGRRPFFTLPNTRRSALPARGPRG